MDNVPHCGNLRFTVIREATALGTKLKITYEQGSWFSKYYPLGSIFFWLCRQKSLKLVFYAWLLATPTIIREISGRGRERKLPISYDPALTNADLGLELGCL